MTQLALPLRLHDYAVFDSFHTAGNEALVAFLAGMSNGSRGPGCFIWGAPACGKTHLLQAICERAGDESVYLPLARMQQAGVGILQGLAQRRFVCLDDLQSVAADADWEMALFELVNQVSDNGGKLAVASKAPPRDSGVVLADLTSRLCRLPVFQCMALPEHERIQALQLRARHRGLELPDETARYLLSRNRRDMASLYRLLDKLDSEAMIAKRRLTIPFAREVLAGGARESRLTPNWPASQKVSQTTDAD